MGNAASSARPLQPPLIFPPILDVPLDCRGRNKGAACVLKPSRGSAFQSTLLQSRAVSGELFSSFRLINISMRDQRIHLKKNPKYNSCYGTRTYQNSARTPFPAPLLDNYLFKHQLLFLLNPTKVSADLSHQAIAPQYFSHHQGPVVLCFSQTEPNYSPAVSHHE